MFKSYYTRRLNELLDTPLRPADGWGDRSVQSQLKKYRQTIPRALADYYSIAGKHWLNENHNRLRSIADLIWIDDKLIFMDENQLVGFWGIARDEIRQSDPMVWQGVNEEPVHWFAEDHRLSRFLMAMWEWTITGEFP